MAYNESIRKNGFMQFTYYLKNNSIFRNTSFTEKLEIYAAALELTLWLLSHWKHDEKKLTIMEESLFIHDAARLARVQDSASNLHEVCQ